MFIGIDIGTGSVRSFTPSFSKTKDISTTHTNAFTNTFITQSSLEIFDAIIDVLPEFNHCCSISFTATCSMVVREKVLVDGKPCLKPFNCGAGDSNQDIILWMDGRSLCQCRDLNQLDNFAKRQIGGKWIPEMGLPKLKWLSDNFDQELYCFELYDWFSYVFKAGFVDKNDNLVVFVEDNDVKYHNTQAMDGSIKGWDGSFLDSIIRTNVHVGKLESSGDFKGVPVMGDVIGKVSTTICGDNDVTITNGCIDCYAGWLSTTIPRKNCISMVAGTSTCFIIECEYNNPITGIWGPFHQLGDYSVYSCGQPASGKLLDGLINDYKHIIGQQDDVFEYLEQQTRELETCHNTRIGHLIKYYFYYGDKYGNRSPLNDFNMNEMIIDGKNRSQLGVSLFEEKSLLQLIIKYNLILEFLAIQTHQILKAMEPNIAIDSIILSGSQAKNTRFIELLHYIPGKQIYLLKHNEPKYNVASGSMNINQVLQKGKPKNDYYQVQFETDQSLVLLYKKKTNLVIEMSEIQQRYSEEMSSL